MPAVWRLCKHNLELEASTHMRCEASMWSRLEDRNVAPVWLLWHLVPLAGTPERSVVSRLRARLCRSRPVSSAERNLFTMRQECGNQHVDFLLGEDFLLVQVRLLRCGVNTAPVPNLILCHAGLSAQSAAQGGAYPPSRAGNVSKPGRNMR
jgi:hypothetical protein